MPTKLKQRHAARVTTPVAVPYLTRRFDEAKQLEARGQLDAAAAIYKNLISIFDRHHLNPARCLGALGYVEFVQRRFPEAKRHFERSLKYDPNFYEAEANLAACAREQQQWVQAEEHALRALKIKPDGYEALSTLGFTRLQLHKHGLAVHNFLMLLALKPDDWGSLAGLAIAYVSLGDIETARALYSRALSLAPTAAPTHSNLLFCLHYDPDMTNQALLAEHRRFAAAQEEKSTWRPFSNSRKTNRPLRVGYISGDFIKHVVSLFVEEVITGHRPEQVEVFCYSNNCKEDEVTQRFKNAVPRWRRVDEKTDSEVERMIREDEIDILVDLSGHTSRNRLPVLARKPAPIQASWCGYFNTTGLEAMDYLIADRMIAPPEEEPPWTEKPLYMPNSYVCFRPTPAPDVNELPAGDNGYITFGCLNNPSKINRHLVTLWTAILETNPGSRLLLKHFMLGDPLTRERVDRLFREAGLPRNRYDLLDNGGNFETLRAYNSIDIALDCHPYNGGTTTCEALWMGVPVITLRGDRFVSRVGSSLLTYTGMSGCIAESPLDYVQRASHLAHNKDTLAHIRRNLRTHLVTTPVFDTKTFIQGLEDAYRRAFEQWCNQH